MLVVPSDVLLLEILRFLRWWWRVGDLGDEVGSGCFSDAVDEHTQKRDFEEEEKGDCEAVEHARTVVEPEFLLLRGVADAGEVGIKLELTLAGSFF